jgi:hypothetical protein
MDHHSTTQPACVGKPVGRGADALWSYFARHRKRSIVGGVLAVLLAWLGYAYLHLFTTAGMEAHGIYPHVNLKEMGNFRFDETRGTVNDVPTLYRDLDGHKVQLVGQMYVDDTAALAVDHFQLVYSIQNCCFGGPPRVQERVFAHVAGARVGVVDGLARVVGILHVRAVAQGGRVTSLYDLDVQTVEAE